MKQFFVFVLFSVCFLGSVHAQFPPLDINADQIVTQTGGTVGVSVTAGNNWQNITTINGTIQFDTTVISYNQMSYWGLNFPANANFVYHGGGLVSWTWTSLITIGPTLSPGAVVFTLDFNVVGVPGDSTPVNFVSNPQPMYWYNGFGWSGTNFNEVNGWVKLICGVPTAAFQATDSLLTVDFADQSPPTVINWLWDFGDGNISTQQNPTHTYAQPGNYLVCLVVSDSCGTDSSCQTLQVCPSPVAAFSEQGTELNYSFTDASSPATTTWFWDFGDGNTSTQQNPAHSYQLPGTYTVGLVASNACGADTSCSQVTVTCTPPTAVYSDSIAGLTFYFQDQSTTGPTSWFWDFGDGNTSTQQNPTHTYGQSGIYTVCLVATSLCGSDTTCGIVTAVCPAPQAAFSDSAAGLTLYFSDQSAINPTNWAWDFGDGNTSTQQNPTHTYALPGTYTVCLVASSNCGADSTCMTVTASCPAPAAAYSHSVNGNDVQFTDLSQNAPTSWFWDFGDGNTSTQQNPLHTYVNQGAYTVCLVASSLCGADTSCTNVQVGVNGTTAPWADGLHLSPNPASGQVAASLESGQLLERIEVTDLNGRQLLLLEDLAQSRVVIDLGSMPAGLYLISVEASTGRWTERLLLR